MFKFYKYSFQAAFEFTDVVKVRVWTVSSESVQNEGLNQRKTPPSKDSTEHAPDLFSQ